MAPIGLGLFRSGLCQRKTFVHSLVKPFVHLAFGTIGFWILGSGFASKGGGDSSNDQESREERRRKRKSRWGGADGAEKTFIPGMPTMMPQGLSADQEEAYLRKSLN